LQAAEKDGFDVFLTTDTNLAYQQNLIGRKLAIVVLSRNNGKPLHGCLTKSPMPLIAQSGEASQSSGFPLTSAGIQGTPRHSGSVIRNGLALNDREMRAGTLERDT
jgi:hypothetical protein